MMMDQKSAFVRIVQQHMGIINSLCQIYYQQAEDRQDARQDIVLQLWKSYPSFRAESAISTWIYRVGLNTLLAKKRKEKRRPQSQAIDPLMHGRMEVASGVDDDLLLLRSLIAGLKDTDKALVVLYLEGYKNKEIAEMLCMSTSNVSTKLNRIKKDLKKKYQNTNHETR
ncbi:MAG: RNA polymerase sigma factor [Bacteroidota bacterium]